MGHLRGGDRAIRVLNRPSVSGTYQTLRNVVLGDNNFGTTPNITNLVGDATTPMLQKLVVDGIGYANYGQVADQRTVRVLAIVSSTPEADAYPFQRSLFYAYRQPPDPAVKAFLSMALRGGQNSDCHFHQGSLGLEKDLSTPISSSRDSSMAPRMALPLSAPAVLYPLAYLPGEIGFCDFTRLKRVAITSPMSVFSPTLTSAWWSGPSRQLFAAVAGPCSCGPGPPAHAQLHSRHPLR